MGRKPVGRADGNGLFAEQKVHLHPRPVLRDTEMDSCIEILMGEIKGLRARGEVDHQPRMSGRQQRQARRKPAHAKARQRCDAQRGLRSAGRRASRRLADAIQRGKQRVGIGPPGIVEAHAATDPVE